MPLQKLQFRPGVNREGTNYSNEGGWFAGDKIRFRSGYPEKLGGWQSVSNPTLYTFKGIARTMWNWVTLAYADLNAVGTNCKVYIENGGDYHDITPNDPVTAVSLGTNPYATVSGLKLVTVTASGHGITAGTYVTLGTTVTVNNIVINGEYEIITVPDGNTYTIIGSTVANATGSGGGSGKTALYNIPAGLATYTTGTGWGAGIWNGVVTSSISTTLSAALNNSATSISVTSTTGFAASGSILIESELITYSGVSGGNTFTGCARGTGTTSATSHLSGITVRQATGTSGSVGWGQAATVGVGQQLRLWSFDNYGQDLVMAIRGGKIYYWEANTSAYDPALKLSTVATTEGWSGTFVPTATLQIFTADTQRFGIAFGANSYDPTDANTTFDPMLVRWSDQENIYDWVPTATNQSGELRLSNGSTIVTAVHSRQEILIYTDTALFVMQYLGPPYVWGFNLIADNLSVMSPNAVISINNITYWMGVDKFYTYTGRVETLPCTLRQYLFNDFNYSQAYQVVSGSNEGYNEVWWHYPSANSPVNDRYIIFNYLENIWYYGTMNRTAWLDSPLRAHPMAAFSVKTSYLNPDTLNPTADITATSKTIVLVDGTSYPYSGAIQVDDEIITYTSSDGNTLLDCTRGAAGTTAAAHKPYTTASFITPNQTLFHEVGVNDNLLPTSAPIEAYISSSDFDIGDGHNFGFVWRIIPDINLTQSAVSSQVTMTVQPKQNSGSVAGVPNPTTIQASAYTIDQYTGQVYTRLRGRQMSFKISSTALDVAWQLGTPRIDIRPDGRR